jgi:membrane-bound lytic murein transglycosylase B
MFVPVLKISLHCIVLWGWILLLSGCAATQQKSAENTKPAKPSITESAVQTAKPSTAAQPAIKAVGSYRAATIAGDFSGYPALNQFVDQMVQKHSFQREYLYGVFSQAKRKQWTLDYLHQSDLSLKSKPGRGSWSRYRSKFLDDRHISGGVSFWQKYQPALKRASQQYGVPAEYILGIMAVETSFGGNVGNHRVIDALTTLGFDYQRRGEYFRSELENFLVMTGTEALDPAKPVGSFAGAMGLGQFMPSSFLQWAVDFNGDGRRDLWDPEDAIGSIANYFAQHGWQRGQPVVSDVRVNDSKTMSLEPGLDNQYTLASLGQAGITPVGHCNSDYPLRLLLLKHQDRDEYLLGHPNFYAITRYNQSTYYAMAVHELAQSIKTAYQKTGSAKAG